MQEPTGRAEKRVRPTYTGFAVRQEFYWLRMTIKGEIFGRSVTIFCQVLDWFRRQQVNILMQ